MLRLVALLFCLLRATLHLLHFIAFRVTSYISAAVVWCIAGAAFLSVQTNAAFRRLRGLLPTFLSAALPHATGGPLVCNTKKRFQIKSVGTSFFHGRKIVNCSPSTLHSSCNSSSSSSLLADDACVQTTPHKHHTKLGFVQKKGL